MRILCIDTEPETVAYLRSTPIEGVTRLEVQTAEMGYRTGARDFVDPPHEFDLLVCDLRRPTCFDRSDWGPGKNSNGQVRPIPYELTTNEILSYEVQSAARQTVYQPQFQMVDEFQISKPLGDDGIGPRNVLRAITVAGIPAILFLNPEWLYRSVRGFPNFFGIRWKSKRTRATLFQVHDKLRSTLPEIGAAVSLEEPLLYSIERGPWAIDHEYDFISNDISLISNAIDETFAQVSQCGRGNVWLLPPTTNNAEIARLAAQRLALIKAPLSTVDPEPRPAVPSIPEARIAPQTTSAHDVFISHASEDKDAIVRPLATALHERGVNVWYDEFTLKVGDSLRANIDRGLAASRYGIVVLSKAFFEKQWPQAELDGMATRQTSQPGKFILPVWHGVGLDDVKAFSPMLAGLLAARSIDGIDAIVQQLLEVIRPDLL